MNSAATDFTGVDAEGQSRMRTGPRWAEEIVSLRPEYTHVMDEESGQITIIPAENVPLGSLCSVPTGDKIPADGIVMEGSPSLHENRITGEARLVDKEAGFDLLSLWPSMHLSTLSLMHSVIHSG